MVYKNKKAAQGVGTLIIFIAMILVAAVAAGVLIQTASSLQSKALNAGKQVQEELTTNIDVVQVYTSNTSDGLIGTSDDDKIEMIVRLGSGSDPIKLSDLLVKFDTKSGTQTLTSGSTSSDSNYATEYIVNGSNHQNNYLVEGDLAKIEFVTGADVGEAESVTLRLIAKNGAVKPVDITTPSAMVKVTTYLYP